MVMASAIGADLKFGPNWDTIGAMCEKSFPMATAAGLVSYFSLMVNNRGTRFLAEDGQYPEIFHVMVEHLKAGDTAFFMVHDAKSLAAISDGSFDLEASTRRGSVIRADTLEELAQKMEVPQAAFLATVARYNGLGQNDTDFSLPTSSLCAWRLRHGRCTAKDPDAFGGRTVLHF
jgi:hypothetical protein